VSTVLELDEKKFWIVLAFAVQSSDPAAASVKDNAAETTALNWAVRFYGAQDIGRLGQRSRSETHPLHPQLQQKAKPFKWTYAETDRRIRTTKKSM
jgi:hypothetical protein